jgi:hypothetical protein
VPTNGISTGGLTRKGKAACTLIDRVDGISLSQRCRAGEIPVAAVGAHLVVAEGYDGPPVFGHYRDLLAQPRGYSIHELPKEKPIRARRFTPGGYLRRLN